MVNFSFSIQPDTVRASFAQPQPTSQLGTGDNGLQRLDALALMAGVSAATKLTVT
jgi:hypothetical protein